MRTTGGPIESGVSLEHHDGDATAGPRLAASLVQVDAPLQDDDRDAPAGLRHGLQQRTKGKEDVLGVRREESECCVTTA